MVGSDWTTWTWLVHMGTTLAMVGLIWTVQLCHYPLFASVGPDAFRAYHARHTHSMSLVVVPLMLIEAGTCLALLASGVAGAWFWLGAGCLAVAWATTFFVSVPHHGTLADGFDPVSHRGLVHSNWIRTLAWTVRGTLVLVLTPVVI